MLFNSILQLEKSGHNIVLIITSKVEQYQYKKKEEDFLELAKKLGVDFLLTEKLNSNQTYEYIRKTGPDIAISVNWKTLIPKTEGTCGYFSSQVCLAV